MKNAVLTVIQKEHLNSGYLTLYKFIKKISASLNKRFINTKLIVT